MATSAVLIGGRAEVEWFDDAVGDELAEPVVGTDDDVGTFAGGTL
jgi:hypothetical protein